MEDLDTGGIIAIVTSVGALIAALAAAYRSASQTQVDRLEREAKIEAEKRDRDAKEEGEKRDREARALAETQRMVDLSVTKEFERLHAEIARQEKEQDRYRGDLDRLRKKLDLRDEEMTAVRLELSTERAVSNAQSKRIAEMENKMADYLAYIEVLIAAMRDAGVPIPERRKPGTGPLPALGGGTS